MQHTRVSHAGRTFTVKTTKSGATQVVERVLWMAGHPFLEAWTNRVIFHSGKGRKPGPLAREVLALAKEIA